MTSRELQRCSVREAVRSAILAAGWLLVHYCRILCPAIVSLGSESFKRAKGAANEFIIIYYFITFIIVYIITLKKKRCKAMIIIYPQRSYQTRLLRIRLFVKFSASVVVSYRTGLACHRIGLLVHVYYTYYFDVVCFYSLDI